MSDSLKKIFNPQTVAVVGASSREGTVGYALMKNLIGQGYEGTVFPVNLRHRSVQGVKAYKSVKKIPDPIDLAVISTPAATVPGIVKECGEAGVGGLLIISAGFKEAGEEGKRMSREIQETARKYGMRFIGPNCLGLINPRLKLNASFAGTTAQPGNIAFISQSGALCTAILDWAREQNVGFSNFVSIGSMVDVGFHDLIDYFGKDPNTSSILIYMESLSDARRFLSAARAFSRTKPIIVLKAGKSTEGAKATLSHTGSLAGNDAAFNAVFERAGIIRADTIAQLFNCAQALAMQPRPQGNRLAIVTNAGGPGVLATDHLIGCNGRLAELSADTYARLNEVLPPTWSHNNPVDVIGDASAERYREAVKACMLDPNADAVLVILTVQAITRAEDVARELVELGKTYKKTVLVTFMGEHDVQEGRDILEAGGIPNYRYPESAVDVFLKMYSYSHNLELLYETPSNIPHEFSPDMQATRKLLDRVVSEGRYQLTELEGKELMNYYQIPTAQYRLAKSAKEAVQHSEELGFPVVMKIASPDIAHKTDVGGVILNIKKPEAAREAYEQIVASAKKAAPDARIEGVFVEQMISKRYELLIGAKKDPILGPVIAFGMGGVAVEVFKDLNIGLPPLNMALAMRIIEDTKIYELLKGYRGMPPVDLRSIQFLLYKFAYLVMDFPELREIDINPFVVDEEGGVVLDAAVMLDEETAHQDVKPYSHLVISPYPRELITPFTLRNGEEVLLRPIKPEDEPLEAEMFTRLSKQTKYFRFFGYVPTMTHDLLTRYTQIDYDREMAIIGEATEGDRKYMAGVVRLVEDPNGESAEFAIVVADSWQGQGLGNKFTDYILEYARNKGLKMVYANVLKANTVMIHMFRKRGFTLKSEDFETYYAELEL